MKTTHMIEDYRKCLSNCHEAGKFEAYKEYTRSYPDFFNAVFRRLYCCPVETLQEYIEEVDFEHLICVAEKNYTQGICDYIISIVEKSAELLKVDFEFELFLGMELSNIGGCSVPREDKVPYLYIGIDRNLTKEFIDTFVPHEMYHMIRCQMAPITETETLLSRTVEEGLASFVPMWIKKMEWNSDSVSRLLSIQQQQAIYLMENTEQIVEKVLEQGDALLTPQVMEEYFNLTDANAEMALPGYYVGLYFSYLAVRNGIDFNSFSTLSCKEVVELWMKQCLK